jgi:hypothetical protein
MKCQLNLTKLLHIGPQKGPLIGDTVEMKWQGAGKKCEHLLGKVAGDGSENYGFWRKIFHVLPIKNAFE